MLSSAHGIETSLAPTAVYARSFEEVISTTVSHGSDGPPMGAQTLRIGDIRDQQVFENAARGDARGFDALIGRQRARLVRVAESILGSRADAEDVVQDTVLRAWRQAERYDANRGTASAWLSTMVRSMALDLIRRRTAAKSQRAPGVTVEREPAAVRSDVCTETLRAGIALLPALERAVIDLAYFEGLSHGEVARMTNLPLGTVKSRLLAGIRRLRLAVPRSALEILLIDRAQMERKRIGSLLDERLLQHAADMYFIDLLKAGRRIQRTHWGHVDPRKHNYLDGIWRFAPDRAQDRHPVRRVLNENRPQFVPVTSDVWKQQIAISDQHLSFMRMLEPESMICQPLLRAGVIIGALTLARTKASHQHYTKDDAAAAHGTAAQVANVIGGGIFD